MLEFTEDLLDHANCTVQVASLGAVFKGYDHDDLLRARLAESGSVSSGLLRGLSGFRNNDQHFFRFHLIALLHFHRRHGAVGW